LGEKYQKILIRGSSTRNYEYADHEKNLVGVSLEGESRSRKAGD